MTQGFSAIVLFKLFVCFNMDVLEHDELFTFVSKALRYRTFKKTRLLPDLKLLQNVTQHSLFKLCKFHEKINGQFFARGQNVLYNAQILRL